jgi:maltooligosyltrehalose trehalohydrolase
MLFQGQEFGATTPFLYFCDQPGQLSDLIHTGRRKFLGQFRSLAQTEMQDVFADPGSRATFENSKLDPAERAHNAQAYDLYKDLIRLRRDDPVFCNPQRRGLDGAVLSANAFVLRYFGSNDNDRLLIVNLAADLHLDPAPEPLLAPPRDCQWKVLWSSEDPKYGGTGTYSPDSDDNWRIAGNSALVLAPEENRAEEKEDK